MEMGGQRHAPAALPPGKRPGATLYKRMGGDPGPVWTGAENPAPNGIRFPDHPARSESLYRLSHPGPYLGCARGNALTMRLWDYRCKGKARGFEFSNTGSLNENNPL